MGVVVGVSVIVLIVVGVGLRLYCLMHDEEPRRTADGRIIEPSATEPWLQFLHRWFGRRRT